MNISIKEIIQLLGADVRSLNIEQLITGVEFDSRKIEKGNLFVPIQGERDGHDFVSKAIENGAIATFWSRSMETAPKGIVVIQVKDPVEAMQKLAAYYLQKQGSKVIGITGSNGKTTTKDMTASVLSTQYRTYKTQGNYNNHIGTPYTILHMPEDTEMLVLEMGMDHSGEIEVLSKMAKPDIAAITMIGESHIEFFGSRKKIAEAKAEIIKGLKNDGLLIVPGEEKLLEPFIKDISQKVVSFGMTNQNQIQSKVLEENKDMTTFNTNLFPSQTFTIPLVGTYNVMNALIALIIGDYFQIDAKKMNHGLANVTITQNRTEWLRTKDGVEILSDVYNANPTAMALVLETFSDLDCVGEKIVVLGDMLELGEFSKEMHEKMSEHIDSKKIDNIFLYGKEMEFLKMKLLEKFPKHQLHYYSVDQKKELINDVKVKAKPNNMIMIKGSNGMNLKEVIENIMK